MQIAMGAEHEALCPTSRQESVQLASVDAGRLAQNANLDHISIVEVKLGFEFPNRLFGVDDVAIYTQDDVVWIVLGRIPLAEAPSFGLIRRVHKEGIGPSSRRLYCREEGRGLVELGASPSRYKALRAWRCA